MDNTLIRLSIIVDYNDKDLDKYTDRCSHEILKHMAVYDKIYSYAVEAIYDNGTFHGIRMSYMVSQTEEYNTIDVLHAIAEICIILRGVPTLSNKNEFIAYAQPPLELILRLYEPLVCELTNKVYRQWSKYIDYDDAKQLCYLSICELYNKGYYIHKNIVMSTFSHKILRYISKYKRAPEIVSLDTQVRSDKSNSGRDTINDSVADESAEQALLDVEDNTGDEFVVQRAMVLGIISERQYEILISEYSNHTTNATTNRLVYQIKQKLKGDKR